MGDPRENPFPVDGQPITDQQSKIFSNQIPLDAMQSMEVIPGGQIQSESAANRHQRDQRVRAVQLSVDS
jgi:hypothetical protein